MRKILISVGVVSLSILTILIYARFGYQPQLLTQPQIAHKAELLNDMAAVFVPQKIMDFGRLRTNHLSLFVSVEHGHEINDAQSQQYRLLYQSILFHHQLEFRLLDSDIQFMQDVAMTEFNNVGGSGIDGLHDHHDMSVRSNFDAMSSRLTLLRTDLTLGRIQRIALAVTLYKDLMDILLHLGTVPHTKSITYIAPVTQNTAVDSFEKVDASIQAQQLFELALREFKLSQFSAINSKDYREHIAKGLQSYEALVLLVQNHIHKQLTPFELYFVGRWGGWQSFSPMTLGYVPDRALPSEY